MQRTTRAPRRVPPQNRIWLSHHWPGEEHRCVAVGSRWVCRRCLWFHPAWMAVTVLAFAGIRWPTAADAWLLVLLPLPVVVEWWFDQLGAVAYSPRRQVVTSLLAAPAVGVGVARYLRDPGDALFWAVVLTGAALTAAPWLWSMRRRDVPTANRE